MMMQKEEKPRQRLSPQERYAQLLNIAIELNAQKGLGRVGHGDIAKAVNVSTGTVFNYFPTIDALNLAILDTVRNQTFQLFEDAKNIEDLTRPSPESLMSYSYRLHNLVATWPALFKVFLSWSQSFDEPFRAQFLDLKTSIIDVLRSILGEREHADVDAHILYGTGLLYAQMKLEGYPEEELMKLATRVTELMT